MSLEHMENWQVYGIGGEAHLTDGVYAIATTSGIKADPDPSGMGLPVLSMDGGFGGYDLRYILNAQVATLGVAMRVYLPNLPGTGGPHFIRLLNAAAQRLCYLAILPTGQIGLYNDTNTLLATSDLAWKLTAKAWNHIEVKLKADAAVGEIEIRVNGISALVATGLNTLSGHAGPIALVDISGSDQASNNTAIYFKDWVIWNTNGAHNNDFFGTVTVVSLIPDSDTTLGAWTLTGGATGFSILDTAPPNDTHYLDAAYPGGVESPSQFGMSVLPVDVSSVRALQSMVRAAKTDGGDGQLQTSVISGASQADGVDRPITGAFTYWKDIFEVDPATGDPWTIAAANAINLQLNRTV